MGDAQSSGFHQQADERLALPRRLQEHVIAGPQATTEKARNGSKSTENKEEQEEEEEEGKEQASLKIEVDGKVKRVSIQNGRLIHDRDQRHVEKFAVVGNQDASFSLRGLPGGDALKFVKKEAGGKTYLKTKSGSYVGLDAGRVIKSHVPGLQVAFHEVDLGPLSDELPHGLVKKLAQLIANENPYIQRQIVEECSGCQRFQFLRQCIARNEYRCSTIWNNLDDRDRREFYRACQLESSRASEIFFMDIMEPDSYTWTLRDASTDAGSSVSDVSSEAGGISCSDSGSAASDITLNSLAARTQDRRPSSCSVASDISVSSMASIPRRRFAA